MPDTERYFGKTCRSFTLPGDFDGDQPEPGRDDRVLSLRPPNKGNRSTPRMAVSRA